MNVLLVEDDYLDAMNVQRAFTKLNLHHKLFIARNGKEALQMLRGQEKEKIEPAPDMLLLDLNMPKMNGIELLRELRTNNELEDAKIFVMTTSDEEADRDAAMSYGVDGYIIKPLSFESFDNPNSSMDSFNLMCALLK